MRRALVILAVALFASASAAQSTAFTYQGDLQAEGAPANGVYDMRFTPWNALTSGLVFGTPVCVNDVQVSNGKFTAVIDLGQFNSPVTRYLEVDVRIDAGADCSDLTGFTTLSPRQQLTAAPIANHAKAAYALDAADGFPSSAVFVDNAGFVGIGTTTPGALLHVKGANEGLRVQGPSAGNSNSAWISFYDSVGTALGYVGDASSGDSSMYLTSYANDVHIYTAFGAAISAKSSGNVGIGTTAPVAKLDVRGSIRLGSVAQYYALGSNRNDHMIRGIVNTNGTISEGTGFSVDHTNPGIYVIYPTNQFATRPSVSATSIAQARKSYVINSQVNFITIGSTDASNTLIDGGFHFIAIGE